MRPDSGEGSSKRKLHATKLVDARRRPYWRMTPCAWGCAAARVADGWKKKPIEAGSSIMIWKRKARWTGAIVGAAQPFSRKTLCALLVEQICGRTVNNTKGQSNERLTVLQSDHGSSIILRLLSMGDLIRLARVSYTYSPRTPMIHFFMRPFKSCDLSTMMS